MNDDKRKDPNQMPDDTEQSEGELGGEESITSNDLEDDTNQPAAGE